MMMGGQNVEERRGYLYLAKMEGEQCALRRCQRKAFTMDIVAK